MRGGVALLAVAADTTGADTDTDVDDIVVGAAITLEVAIALYVS